MGVVSWNTSDTKRSIPLSGSTRETFTVYMMTGDQVYQEDAYNGYGCFGGKDFNIAVYELNLMKYGIEKVINMYNTANCELFKKVLPGTKSEELSYGDKRNIGIILESACRQQLFSVVMPKLVENLDEALKLPFDDISVPSSCEYDGCAYPEDDEHYDHDDCCW